MRAAYFRFINGFLLFTLLLAGLFGATSAAALGAQSVAGAVSVSPQTSIAICSGSTVPSGYVITSSGTDYRCPGSGNYRWTLEPAYDGIVACLGSSYPSPYFITSQTSNAYQCTNGGLLGAMTLNLPYNGIVACVNGVLWTPWVITANGSSYKCNGYGTITLSQPIDGLRICSNSVIPTGWYADSASQFYICAPYWTETLHKTPSAATVKSAPFYSRDGNQAVMPRDGDGAN
jgi:hypothetical protein